MAFENPKLNDELRFEWERYGKKLKRIRNKKRKKKLQKFINQSQYYFNFNKVNNINNYQGDCKGAQKRKENHDK